MAEISERERINQDLRERVHVMLDNARGLLLTFNGPETKKAQLNFRYEKCEGLVSDRSRRLKSDNLQKLIKAVTQIIIEAGGQVEDISTAVPIPPVTSSNDGVVSEKVPSVPAINPPEVIEKPDAEISTATKETCPVKTITPTSPRTKAIQQKVPETKEDNTIKEISPAKVAPIPVATVTETTKSETIQQRILIREVISEADRLKQQPQIPWRTPTRLEPLPPSKREDESIIITNDRIKEKERKSNDLFVKPIQPAKEPERLALKYKIKKRPAESPLNNDSQFKKPTLPVHHEHSKPLFHRRHQLQPAVPNRNIRDPRTYGEYCQQRMIALSNQQRFENQNQQYFKHRPHAPHSGVEHPVATARPVAAMHPVTAAHPIAPAPEYHSNPLLPQPVRRPASKDRAFAAPAPIPPSKPKASAPPKAPVHPTTRPVSVASSNSIPPKQDTRKTNPVYSKDEPIPLGKKEPPKKPNLTKTVAAVVPEKPQEEPKTDEQPSMKPTETAAPQEKSISAEPKEKDLQKNLMDLLKEIGDEDKVKQILDVMNRKSDDEVEEKNSTKKEDGDAKSSANKKDEPATKGKKGKKFKRILSKPDVDSSSEDDSSKKNEGKKERTKKRTTGGSREVSALIENVSDWISKSGEAHYTRRRGAIIQPTTGGSPPAKQAKSRKSNEEARSGASEDEVVAEEVASQAREKVPDNPESEEDIKDPAEDDDSSLLTVTKSPPAPKGKQKSKEGNFVYNDKKTVHYNSSYSSNCALCSFNGSAIVDHYVYEHKQYEVFVSRISPKMADIIRSDLFLTNGTIINEGIEDEKIRFKCYFCLTWRELTRSGWIEHMAAHTGEYRYRCTSCPVMSKTEELESSFYHEKTCLKPKLALYNNIEFQDNHIYGFICDACNYIQIRRVNMERHLKREHPSSDVTCTRFSIVNYKIDAKPIIDEDQIMAEFTTQPTVMIPLHPKAEPIEPCEIVNQPFTEDDEMGEAECRSEVPLRRTSIRLESIHIGQSGIPSEFGHRPFSFKMEQELQGTQISSSAESPMSPEPQVPGLEMPSSSEADAVVPIIQIQSVQGGFDFNKVLLKQDKDTEYDSDASDKTMDFNMSDGAEGQNGENSNSGEGQTSTDGGNQQADGNSGTSSSGGNGDGVEPSGSGSSSSGAAGGGGGDDGRDRKNNEFPLPFVIKAEKDEEEKKEEEQSTTNLENIVIKTEKPDEVTENPLPAEGEWDFVELVLDSTRIEHVAFIEHQSEMLFLCLTPGCKYISKSSQDFSTHINRKHSTTIWDGYCHPCQSQIVIVDNCTIANELQHLMDVHARRKTPTVDVPVSAPNLLRIRRIPGDTLSKESNPPPLAPIMPTGSILATAGPSNVAVSKPIIITSAATIAPVVSLAGNTMITPTLTIPAQIRPVIPQTAMLPSTAPSPSQPPALAPVSITANANVNSNISALANLKLNTVRLKPWTNMVTTKNQEHCRNMLEEVSLLCLYKCMSRSCAFTTNNRFFMEQHLQLHESLHTNNAMSRKCWLECAYCDIIATNNNVLLAHIDAEHATCGFQCNLCFYRSRDPTNVVVHQKTYHPMGTIPKRILIMPDHLKSFGDDEWKAMQDSLRKNVLPLHCTSEYPSGLSEQRR